MLRGGDQVNSDAENVTPEEARGLKAVQVRSNERSRQKVVSDKRASLQSNYCNVAVQKVMHQSCFNLAVWFVQFLTLIALIKTRHTP